jgi:ACR3 family arsenite transporter
MWVLAGMYVEINPWMILQKMLLIVVLPLAAGMATRKILVKKYGPKHYKHRVAPYFPAISTCGMLSMVFIIISTQAKLIVGNFNWVLLVILGIGTLYPLLFGLTIFFCKIFHIGHGHGMALGYSVAAKNHAITIGVATTAFGGTLAVLPAAVAPIIQIPTMLLYLKFSDGIRKYLGGPEKDYRKSSSKRCFLTLTNQVCANFCSMAIAYEKR